MTRKEVKKVNKVLTNFPVYWNYIPFKEICEELKKFELIPIQEDNTAWSGFLCGDSQQEYFTLGHYLENADFYVPIERTQLSLSWYNMGNGRYEILTHLT